MQPYTNATADSLAPYLPTRGGACSGAHLSDTVGRAEFAIAGGDSGIVAKTQASRTPTNTLVCVIIRQFPVVEAFLGFRAGQVVQNPTPLAVALHLVRQHVPHVFAPVCAHHVKGNLALFQFPNQKLSRHTEHAGRLHRGQLRIVLDDGDRLALAQVCDQLHQTLVERDWQALCSTIGPDQLRAAALDLLI